MGRWSETGETEQGSAAFTRKKHWEDAGPMGTDDRIDGELENYHRPGGAGGTPREIPDPTDEDFIEIVSTLYDALGDDVEVFAQTIGMDREGAEAVIARIRESREDGPGRAVRGS